MRQRIVPAITLLLGLASAVQAGVLYPVSVNTSTITGTAGSLDFQFNPGPLVSQSAWLAILNFATDGTLTGAPSETGAVGGGPLPAMVSFVNSTQLNDYFQTFTFGTSLSFEVLLYGPAVEFPDGVSTSGSTFAFSMFSDAAGTVPVLTSDPNGFAATVGINLDGTTTATVSSPQTTVGAPTIVPEPGSFALAGSIVVLAAFRRLKRRPPAA
jgi:hypothetical protein